jgi:hypothetical protein
VLGGFIPGGQGPSKFSDVSGPAGARQALAITFSTKEVEYV